MSTTQSRKRAAQDKQLTQLNMKVTSQEQHLTAQAKKLTVQAVEQIARGQKIKYTDLFNAELRLSQADLVESNKYLYCLNKMTSATKFWTYHQDLVNTQNIWSI